MNGRSRSISRILCPSEPVETNVQRATVIPLARELPLRSSVLPGCQTARVTPSSLFGFAPCGVCQACLLLSNRCALTAPFHPYLKSSDQWLVVSRRSHFPASHGPLVLLGGDEVQTLVKFVNLPSPHPLPL